MTYRQIAQELGIAEKTVENQMGTALRKKSGSSSGLSTTNSFVLFLLDFFV
jgi:DNA-binding CsgD family transcriptional regulator